MKPLVVYYSLDGNTRLIAESIALSVNADLLRLKPKRDLNPNGFMKYFIGGMQVVFKKKPKLLHFDNNLEEHKVIFIGTPVWNSTYAPALRTFFSKARLKKKKIALFCCYGGKEGKTFGEMEKELQGNNILGKISFKEPLKKGVEEREEEAAEWAKRIMMVV